MGQTSKEDKSFSVEDNLPSKDLSFGAKTVVFAHEANEGDKSIDLNNLVTPSDMAANGFTQPLAGEIEAAHLTIFRKKLRLVSTRGELTQFLDYKVTDAGTINFLPTSPLGLQGALEGEIFTGYIEQVKSNSLIVGDVREYDVTLDDTNFTPGDTILNVGVEYNVNANPLNQTGEMRVYKNGKRIYRNVGNAAPVDPPSENNGNYHEVDAGTGKGTTIELNEPAQEGDIFGFDFGLKLSSGDLQIFGEIERLQGSFLKLIEDAAVDFGTSKSDYLAANPSEIERRSFGDLVLAIKNALAGPEFKPLQIVRANNAPTGSAPGAFAYTALAMGADLTNYNGSPGTGFDNSSLSGSTYDGTTFTAGRDMNLLVIAGTQFDPSSTGVGSTCALESRVDSPSRGLVQASGPILDLWTGQASANLVTIGLNGCAIFNLKAGDSLTLGYRGSINVTFTGDPRSTYFQAFELPRNFLQAVNL